MWYYAIKYIAEIHERTADFSLPNQITPYEMGTGITPDISAYLQFTFWERVIWLDNEEKWPASKERNGYWLGVCHNVGDHLTYYILDDQSKQVVCRSVVCPYNCNKNAVWDSCFLLQDELDDLACQGENPKQGEKPK
jgi:hypothetical protein